MRAQISLFFVSFGASPLTKRTNSGYNCAMETDFIYDTLIIGAGPAGLTAGLYAARAGLKCAVLEKASAGGLAVTAASVENYPGIKATDGFSLCYTMLEQCTAAGAELLFENATMLDLARDVKKITLASGKTLLAKTVIIASGASPKRGGVTGENDFLGRGVSYCATCDGAFFKGGTVAVIGGGSMAAEDALFLDKLAKKTYLVHRGESLKAEDALVRSLENSTVEIINNSFLKAISGAEKVTQMALENTKNGTSTVVSVDCVFIAIGKVPNSAWLPKTILDERGYVTTTEDMRTQIDGVYAVGDVRSKSLRQIVTACADGAIAATDVAKTLFRD